jgi:hypothetical protein
MAIELGVEPLRLAQQTRRGSGLLHGGGEFDLTPADRQRIEFQGDDMHPVELRLHIQTHQAAQHAVPSGTKI